MQGRSPETTTDRQNTVLAGKDATPKRDTFIAVMGGTGSGKTTFINLASGSNLRVGDGLDSCTSVVQTAQPFEMEGSMVTLVDTPGFNDTTKTDAEILQIIALHLSTTYNRGQLISGVIFIHRITDYRFGGSSRRNFDLVQQICGDEGLKNLAVVTNMWNVVALEIAEAREQELRTNDLFFKPVLDHGANILRHDNSQTSAHNIVRQFLHRDPFPLRIQLELEQGKELIETTAGQALGREYSEQIRKNKSEIEDLRLGMEEAAREQDEKTRQELETERQALMERVSQSQCEVEGLSSLYREKKAKLELALQANEDQGRARGDVDGNQRERESNQSGVGQRADQANRALQPSQAMKPFPDTLRRGMDSRGVEIAKGAQIESVLQSQRELEASPSPNRVDRAKPGPPLQANEVGGSDGCGRRGGEQPGRTRSLAGQPGYRRPEQERASARQAAGKSRGSGVGQWRDSSHQRAETARMNECLDEIQSRIHKDASGPSIVSAVASSFSAMASGVSAMFENATQAHPSASRSKESLARENRRKRRGI